MKKKPTSKSLIPLIEKIHSSNLYGIIVECGNGCSITNSLMSIEGSSNTILESKQPYSKVSQKNRYKGKYERSVSYDFVKDVIKTELKQAKFIHNDDVKNFILVSSFQLKPHGINNTLTHGWVGLWCDGEERYYHISIPEPKQRLVYFSKISSFGIELLYSLIDPKKTRFGSPYIDIVIDGNDSTNTIKSTLQATIYNENYKGDYFIVVNPNNEVVRFEDLVRDKIGLILQKGSYNPIHEGHIEIMDLSIEEYTKYAAAFFISINRYDKPPIGLTDLLQRITSITSKGYYVVLSKNPLFKDSLRWIRDSSRYRQLPIVFPMGVDTINRIVQTDIDEKEQSVPKSLKSVIDWDSHFQFLCSTVYAKTTLLVYFRKDYFKNTNVRYLESIIKWNEVYSDPKGISSTKIREELSNLSIVKDKPCAACNATKNGIKTRKRYEHTCGKESFNGNTRNKSNNLENSNQN